MMTDVSGQWDQASSDLSERSADRAGKARTQSTDSHAPEAKVGRKHAEGRRGKASGGRLRGCVHVKTGTIRAQASERCAGVSSGGPKPVKDRDGRWWRRLR